MNNYIRIIDKLPTDILTMKKTFKILFLLFLFCDGIQSHNSNLQKDSIKLDKRDSGLITQLDSLNYAYGLSYGDSIKNYYFKNDTTDAPMFSFIDAFDEVFDQNVVDKDEMYAKGYKMANFITKQNCKGLMTDSTITFKQKLFELGLIDALKDSFYLMKPQEAKQFIQRKMNKSKYSSVPDRDEIVIRMLNYAYGMTIGASIKKEYIRGDSVNTKVMSFIDGFKAGNEEIENGYSQFNDMGTTFGNLLKTLIKSGLNNDSTLKVNTELVRHGMSNGLNKEVEWMSPQEARVYFKTTMQLLQDKKTETEFSSNKAAGEKFLAENTKKPGIITTASGLQYEVLIKGNGPLPKDGSKVKVIYTGTLIDGTLFDNSKEPIIFPVNQVIKGWTEAFKLMPVGSKFKIYVPQELAYGSKQQGLIKPFSTLIFEIELLSIED